MKKFDVAEELVYSIDLVFNLAWQTTLPFGNHFFVDFTNTLCVKMASFFVYSLIYHFCAEYILVNDKELKCLL